jgi:phage terminase large subunit GpA-like protein
VAPRARPYADDRGGHVYAYVAKNQQRRVYATIGRDGQRPIWTPGHQPRDGKARRKVPLFVVGVDNAKAELQARLRLAAPGPGFVHIPLQLPGDVLLDESALDQLTSERLVTRYDKRRRTRRGWELARPGIRNEGLDCTVLALWALRALRPDMKAASERLAKAEAPPAPPLPPPAASPPPVFTLPPPPAPPPVGRLGTRRFARSGYLR